MPCSCTLRGLGSRDHLCPDLWREVLRSLNVAHFAEPFRLPVRVRLAQTLARWQVLNSLDFLVRKTLSFSIVMNY